MLVEERKIGECAYTLKDYLRHAPPKDNPNARGKIVLQSNNKDHPEIELTEDNESQDQRYAVIAEFVQVLDEPLDWVTPLYASSDE